MCTVLIALKQHTELPLVLLGNRDEFYARPSLPSHHWEDIPEILGGRDLQSGGTWLAVSRSGRWAVVSNIRGFSGKTGQQSRGLLVNAYLLSLLSPEEYITRLMVRRSDYGPFNLIVGEYAEAWFGSSRGNIKPLAPGIHGLSNADLNTPWPKVERGKASLQRGLATNGCAPTPDQLLSILTDTTLPPDTDLPDTGIGLEQERILAPLFVRTNGYGTRCSTLVRIGCDCRINFIEQNFSEAGPEERREFEFVGEV